MVLLNSEKILYYQYKKITTFRIECVLQWNHVRQKFGFRSLKKSDQLRNFDQRLSNFKPFELKERRPQKYKNLRSAIVCFADLFLEWTEMKKRQECNSRIIDEAIFSSRNGKKTTKQLVSNIFHGLNNNGNTTFDQNIKRTYNSFFLFSSVYISYRGKTADSLINFYINYFVYLLILFQDLKIKIELISTELDYRR